MITGAAATGRVCALIVAAGRGARFGATRNDGANHKIPTNKVLTEIGGRPLLGWTLEAFARCADIEAIILVGRLDESPLLRSIAGEFGGGKVSAVVAGGDDRQASVRNGLAACDGFDFVAVHDAARCGVTPEVISRTVNLAREKNASAVAALPLADTLAKEVIGSLGDGASRARAHDGSLGAPQVADYVPRENLWTIQTPQVFPVSFLRAAHAAALTNGLSLTDDTQLVRRLGEPVFLALGSPENFKVTRAEDAAVMAAVLRGIP